MKEGAVCSNALVCSNCEKLKFYIGERLIAEVEPDRKTYPHLKYAPFAIYKIASASHGKKACHMHSKEIGKSIGYQLAVAIV